MGFLCVLCMLFAYDSLLCLLFMNCLPSPPLHVRLTHVHTYTTLISYITHYTHNTHPYIHIHIHTHTYTHGRSQARRIQAQKQKRQKGPSQFHACSIRCCRQHCNSNITGSKFAHSGCGSCGCNADQDDDGATVGALVCGDGC